MQIIFHRVSRVNHLSIVFGGEMKYLYGTQLASLQRTFFASNIK